jgi:glycosyltransferase involved in cell wall biosynthesis
VRIAFYTHPAFFEPALCLVRELSRRVAVDLLLEISPGAWRSAAFDLSERPLPAGIIPADEVLRGAFPEEVRRYWQTASSFHLVVHPTRRSLHPSSWRMSRQALDFVVARGADVLHVDDVDVSPRLAMGLAFEGRLPIVISVHDPAPHSGERTWRKTLARRLAYSRARRFVLYNRALRSDFIEAYGLDPSTVDVTRLGVYDVFTSWGTAQPGEPRPTVLFFGRLSVYKGLDLFYEAARLIAQRVHGVRFVVAGRAVDGYVPPAPPDLGDRGEIDVIDRYLPTSEAATLFRSASVVVCPYRDATQSGVALTALAFGVPVVATAVGGLPEYVIPQRTGTIVPADDAAAIADAVCSLLLDPTLAAHLRQSIDEAARGDLSWRHTVDVLMATYAAARRE